jgi:4-hydroxybenzoyl-CoA reductase beta subunit
MHLPKFIYYKPATLEAATSLLKTHGPDARVVAGGTELFPRMKYGLNSPKTLIRLTGIPVASPALAADETLVLDALMTLTAASQSQLVQEKVPVLAIAAAAVGSNEIRNMGTLGGNLCQDTRCLYYNQKHDFQFVEPCFKRGGERCYFIPKGKKCWAVFMADTVSALVALDAEIKVVGPGDNKRVFPLEKLYSGDAQCPVTIAPEEIITEIRIPKSSRQNGSAFAKFSLRGGIEFGALNLAAVLDMETDGKTCSNAKIVVGAVSASPLRARQAESFLTGKPLTDQLISETIESVLVEIQPVPHHGFSKAYLTECLRAQIRQVLSAAAGRAAESKKEHV